MHAIRFPLKSGMRNSAIADLQAAPDLLLDDPQYFAESGSPRAEPRRAMGA